MELTDLMESRLFFSAFFHRILSNALARTSRAGGLCPFFLFASIPIFAGMVSMTAPA
jgi:hypothetical protein